jgi:hypothetical protein
VREEEVFPEVSSGRPWLPHSEWDWEESFKTSYREYVENQYEKDLAVYAVHDAVGRIENIQKLAAPWIKSQGTRSRDRQSAGCNGARNATERRKRQLEMPSVVTFVQIGS